MTVNVGGKAQRREDKVSEEKEKVEKFDPKDYSCEILLEKTTKEKSYDKSFPTDAFNVTYLEDGEVKMDVTRSSKQVNIFDMYYDRYGNVQKIEYGHDSVNPSQWGYKPATKKKRRK